MAHDLAAEARIDPVGEIGEQVFLEQAQHRHHRNRHPHHHADRQQQREVAATHHHINDLQHREREHQREELVHEAGEQKETHLRAIGLHHGPEPGQIETGGLFVFGGGFRRPHQHQLEGFTAQPAQLLQAEGDQAAAGISHHQAARARLLHQQEALAVADQGRRFEPMQLLRRSAQGPHLQAQALEDLAEVQQ